MLLHLHFPSSLTFALVVQKQVMMGEAAGTLASIKTGAPN